MSTSVLMPIPYTTEFFNLFVEFWTCEHCNKSEMCSVNVYYSSEVSTCPVCSTSCVGRLNPWKKVVNHFKMMEELFGRQLYTCEVMDRTAVKLGFKSCKDSSDVREFLIRKSCDTKLKYIEQVARLKLEEAASKLKDAEKKLEEMRSSGSTNQVQQVEDVPQVQVVQLDDLLQEHAGKIQSHFCQLETRAYQWETKAQELQLENVALQKQNADLTSFKQSQERAAQKLLFQHSVEKKKHEEQVVLLQANADASQRQCGYWKAVAEAWEKKYKVLETDTGVLEVRFIDLEKKNQALKTEAESLESKCSELDAKANAMEAKAEALEAKYEALEASCEVFQAKSEDLEAKCTDLGAKVGTLDSECAFWKSKAEVLEAQKKDVCQFIKLAERVKMLEDKIQSTPPLQSSVPSLPVAVPTLVSNKKRREVFEEELFTLKRRNL